MSAARSSVVTPVTSILRFEADLSRTVRNDLPQAEFTGRQYLEITDSTDTYAFG
jgi:hypothetical protein